MNQVVANTRQLMKRAHSAFQKNRMQEAIDLFFQVTKQNPTHAEALYYVGFILFGTGNSKLATDYLNRAIHADPTHVDSYLLMCKVLQHQNRANEAITIAHNVTQMAPDNAQAHCTLANLLVMFHQVEEVPTYLESILPRFPNHLEMHHHYCFALKVCGRVAEADAAYQALISKHRVPLPYRMVYELYMPNDFESNAHIDAARAAFQAAIDRFSQEKLILEDLMDNHPLFSLAFHNRDNKEVLRSYTRMLRKLFPLLNFTAPHCKAAPADRAGPIKVGFVSRYMYHHSVGNCYRGAMLSVAAHPDFSVTFFNLSDVMDEKIQEIMDAGVPIVPLTKSVGSSQAVIANHKLDLLIYTDIGMDSTTHYMAMARLAPYQMCFQGHPETTGIDTIDYVISSRSYEPPHAAENYTEQLLCNEGIDTVFKHPTKPERWLTREELGLPADKKLYVCPMKIQKFHPDYDDVLADILASDLNAVLVLFNDSAQQTATNMVYHRLTSKCDPSRIVWMPWLMLEALFSVLHVADAVLDTIHFGGGTTAQYAFGLGIPIVTMPGRYARGRIVYSYYSVMGIEDAPIASDMKDFVTRAVHLANTPDYAANLRNQILEHNTRLFEAAPYGPRLVQLLKDITTQQLEAYKR